MLYKLKENLPTIEILLGYLLFIYLVVECSFSSAVLSLMFFIYIWLFTSICLNKYTFSSFLYVVCGAGIIVAISMFFLTGVEEVPFPQGAIMFHVDGIAKSLFIFFICSIPLVLINKDNNFSQFHSSLDKDKNQSGTKESYDSDLWEEASLDDVESGKYETI